MIYFNDDIPNRIQDFDKDFSGIGFYELIVRYSYF